MKKINFVTRLDIIREKILKKLLPVSNLELLIESLDDLKTQQGEIKENAEKCYARRNIKRKEVDSCINRSKELKLIMDKEKQEADVISQAKKYLIDEQSKHSILTEQLEVLENLAEQYSTAEKEISQKVNKLENEVVIIQTKLDFAKDIGELTNSNNNDEKINIEEILKEINVDIEVGKIKYENLDKKPKAVDDFIGIKEELQEEFLKLL